MEIVVAVALIGAIGGVASSGAGSWVVMDASLGADVVASVLA